MTLGDLIRLLEHGDPDEEVMVEDNYGTITITKIINVTGQH
jgi:hypothetical protein